MHRATAAGTRREHPVQLKQDGEAAFTVYTRTRTHSFFLILFKFVFDPWVIKFLFDPD